MMLEPLESMLFTSSIATFWSQWAIFTFIVGWLVKLNSYC